MTETGNHSYEWLKDMQQLSLFEKEILTAARIKEAILSSKGKCYVAFSGGKDSTVLLHQVALVWKECTNRGLIDDTPLSVIFCNTGNEFLSILKFVGDYCKYIETTIGIKVALHKTMPMYNGKPTQFIDVCRQIGYPVASKKISTMISTTRKQFIHLGYTKTETKQLIEYLQTMTDEEAYNVLKEKEFSNSAILYLTGINSKGKTNFMWKLAKCWIPLIWAPFKCSSKCCDILKKEPSKFKAKELGLILSFTGEMASDGQNRLNTYIKTGCNAFDEDGKGKSKPMGFWTEQDVLNYLKIHKLPFAACYGKLLQHKKTGELKFSSMNRTGCKLCLFGIQMPRGDERIMELYSLEPKIAKWALTDKPNGLGYKKVLDYVRENCNCTVKMPDTEE